MTSICAVIVTYNRLGLLQRSVEAMCRQKDQFRKIYIIDNASTDGTALWYDNERQNLSDSIEYIRLKKNIGGAGGFCYGIEKAYEDPDNEWIVVLDDDAILPVDFNSRLENAFKIFPDTTCFTGNVTRTENGATLKRIMNNNEYTKVDKVSFVSAVFKRKLVSMIGFPEKDYFIWYDDNEYSLRARKYTDIVLINNAVVEHLQGDASMDSLLWKKYYGIRNNLHMVKKHYNCGKYLVFRYSMWIRLFISSVIKQLLIEKDIDRYRARRLLIRDAFRDSRTNSLGVREKYMPGVNNETKN